MADNYEQPSTPMSGPLLEALPASEPTAGDPILEALPANKPNPPTRPNQEPVPEALPAGAPVIAIHTEAILEALPIETAAPPIYRETNPVALLCLFLWRIVCAVVSGLVWLFGVAVLMVGLAALAALPVLQFLSLGYLLEAGGRVARSGRLRDGFIGVRLAAGLGAIVAGSWLLLLPVRFVSSLAHSAYVIDPGGSVARNWRIGLMVLIGVTALFIAVAIWLLFRLLVLLRTGRWLAPGASGYYTEARDAVWDIVGSLRLPYYFWLGLRGAIAAFVWLALPITLIALGRVPGLPLLGFIGALWLALVLLYLPFLQMRLAMTQQLAGAFELGAVREGYRRAPWAFTLAFVVTLLSALPLYLLKIEMVPREAAWLPSLVFVAFIFPARMLTGWAMGRAQKRERPRNWFFRWTGRLPLLPAAAFYVLVVYFTQFTSWNGVWSLYEQHAFLVPVPFFGM
jgi:hypothetical protein